SGRRLWRTRADGAALALAPFDARVDELESELPVVQPRAGLPGGFRGEPLRFRDVADDHHRVGPAEHRVQIPFELQRAPDRRARGLDVAEGRGRLREVGPLG